MSITTATPKIKLKPAMYYEKLEEGKTQCNLCFRRCIISKDKRGFCRNRENRNGILYNIVYGKPSAVHIDPVEKEPQFHMLPGTEILCLGTAGCNFRCLFCHNWHLSQRSIEEMEYIELSPFQVVEYAVSQKIPTISFTYNEPTSFYEYVYDIAKLAKERGVKILWHSNGGINPEPLQELLKYTDAVTIDLKGFTSDFYKKASSAELKPVLQTLKIIKENNIWLEIVNLIVPTFNDNPQSIERMCVWIKKNLGENVPLHFTRFSPSYKLKNLPPTSLETLELAYKIAKKASLKYVYVGNMPGHIYNSTFCSACGEVLIQRVHFQVVKKNIASGKCKFCGEIIPGIWE